MNWPVTHCSQLHLTNLRPTTLRLLQRLSYCLVPMPGKEYRFTEVQSSRGPAARPDARVEFLVYLMQDRTIGEVQRALPAAAAACGLEPELTRELDGFFMCLGRTLKYNAAAFVIEPPVRPDVRAGMTGLLPRTAAEQAAADDLPELPLSHGRMTG